MIEVIGLATYHIITHNLKFTISNLIDQKVLVLVLSEMMYFKSIDGSFAAIADSKTHPQAVAPGFLMYTCWMIRHFDNNPWLRQNCNEDERYIWLHDAKF